MNDDALLTGKCVLLVEDEVSIVGHLEELLGTLGYREIFFATNLADAEQIAEFEAIDVAILDVNLEGGTNTIELGRGLARKGVRVLFMSGFNGEEMSRATRGFEFVEKPLSLPRLKAALQRAFVRRPITAAKSQPLTPDRVSAPVDRTP